MNILAGTLLLGALQAEERRGAPPRPVAQVLPVAKTAIRERPGPRDIAAAKRRERMKQRDSEIDRMLKLKKY